MTAFIDIAESAGVTTEIWFAPIGKDVTTAYQISGVFCKLKSANEKIDVSRVLSTGFTGLFRYYTFKAWANLFTKGRLHRAFGYPAGNVPEYVLKAFDFDIAISASSSAIEMFNEFKKKLIDKF